MQTTIVGIPVAAAAGATTVPNQPGFTIQTHQPMAEVIILKLSILVYREKISKYFL